MSFTKKIIYAMVLGIFFGIILNLFNQDSYITSFIISNILTAASDLFISALKLIIIPLIFFSIVCSIISMSDDISLTRLGIKTLSLYIFTTIIAISLGLFFSSYINYQPILSNSIENAVSINSVESKVDIFPDNIFKSLTDGNIIHLLIFSILIGISASRIKENIRTFIQYFHNFNEVINELVKIIISFTPIAVFCILSKTFATQGLETLMPLMSYFLTVVFVLIIHFFITFSLLLNFFTKLSALKFFKNIKDVIIFSFSTSSSSASIPFTLKTAEEKCGIDKSIGTFTIPLGATINMDGTAIMQGCATFFFSKSIWY